MQKALFLDRDGVINIEKDYLFKVDEFEFIDGIFDLCSYYQNKGYLIIVVTNQSGIARNYYSIDDFNTLTSWMISEFQRKNIKLSHVYFCPHHPDITGVCECRKPKPGMLYKAKKEFNIDLVNSILVGDKERDIESALNAGVRETYLFSELIVPTKAMAIVHKLEDIYNVNTK